MSDNTKHGVLYYRYYLYYYYIFYIKYSHNVYKPIPRYAYNIYYLFDNITMGMIDAGSMYAEWLSTKFQIPPEQFNNVPQPPKKRKIQILFIFFFLFQKEMWKSHENWNISPEGGKGSRPRPAPTMYIWQFPPFLVICWICYIIIFFYLFFLCINIIYRSRLIFI